MQTPPREEEEPPPEEEEPPPPPEEGSSAVVYLLKNGRRTYVGATLYLERRLRQHNGEIRGGARQTSRGTGVWVLACKVSGFRCFNEALKFEFAWRREGRKIRARGLGGRREALAALMARERWSSTSPPACDVPVSVAWL